MDSYKGLFFFRKVFESICINDSCFPVDPDTGIIPAIIFLASQGPVSIDFTEEGFSVKMRAVSVFIPGDKIWSLRIPFDHTSFYLFFC